MSWENPEGERTLGDPQTQAERADAEATERGQDQLPQLTSLANVGACPGLIWKEATNDTCFALTHPIKYSWNSKSKRIK